MIESIKKSYLPLTERKKILLLSDDLRMSSGVGRMSQEIVYGTAHHYNWIQLAGLREHPEAGKFFNLNDDVKAQTGVHDPDVRIIPVHGYGDSNLVRQVIQAEKPDAIMIFTDPRYWIWFFQMEHEIRSVNKIPIVYYNIWDDCPAPHWNFPYYNSCDLLMGISKQTCILNKLVLGEDNYVDIENLDDYISGKTISSYVPHGIDPTKFYPITDEIELAAMNEYRNLIFKGKQIDYVVFHNSRNILRKHTSDIILAFKVFVDNLPEDRRDKCALILHTNPIEEAGTNLIDVQKMIAPNYNVIFSTSGLDFNRLNYLYNIADVTVSIGSNEGWGLSSTESIMAGTCVINNVTGGLQDQIRIEDENGNWFEPTLDFPSNHNGKYKKHGSWAFPVYPSNRSLQGSILTPYIFDDRADFKDVAKAMQDCYLESKADRDMYGIEGREWLLGEEANMSTDAMCSLMIHDIDTCIELFTGTDAFTFTKIVEDKKEKPMGIVI